MGVAVGALLTGAAAIGGALTTTGRAGGATVTGGRTTGGGFLAAASAFLRSRIARIASPGLDAPERSILGRVSTAGLLTELVRGPPLK